MTIQIGTYKTIQGTIGNDVAYVTPKIAYFGNSGDDDIWIQGSEYLYLENQYWWVPSIAVGGTGNDKYTVAEGFAFIADGSKSNADKLLIFGSLDEIEVLFSIDERHIYMSLSSETTIVLFDALNELGAIETIQFQKSSASRPVTIGTDSLMNYRSLPNQTFESLISGGYFNPKVMGVANANEVRNIINRISELTTAGPTYTLTPSVETINEGAVLTNTVTTTNVATGTKLYYALSGTGITTADFSAGALTGEGITDATGKFSFSHTLANDLLTEGTESLSIKLYSDSARTLQIGSTAMVGVVDSSTTTPLVARGNSLYTIVLGPTWEEAEANAVKLGGHLVTINDGAENEWLTQYYGKGKWIGINDKEKEGTFKWSSGEEVVYTNWAPGEPNNASSIQDYGWIEFENGKWDDNSNNPLVFQGIAEIKLAGVTTDYSYSLSKLSGLTSPNSLIGAFENYQFYNLGGNRQGIQKKGTGAIDEITGISTLTFDDSTISVLDGITGVFNQVTGKETKDAQMFRLYNASFNRFPDSDGLKYWINEYSKGITDYRNIAESFIISNEFKQRYGATNTNLEFATNMYKNILGRLPDAEGLNYWVSNLDAGTKETLENPRQPRENTCVIAVANWASPVFKDSV